MSFDTSYLNAYIGNNPANAGGAILPNKTTATSTYEISSGSNAMSVGPVTVASGVSIIVSSGQRWVVI
jgi:hypothetical protein